MENVWVSASLWVGLALSATLLAIWFKISTALSEIVTDSGAVNHRSVRALRKKVIGFEYTDAFESELKKLL